MQPCTCVDWYLEQKRYMLQYYCAYWIGRSNLRALHLTFIGF